MSKRTLAPSPHKITQETLDRLKELEPVDFKQYQALVRSGQIKPIGSHKNQESGQIIKTKISFRRPVPIYFDSEHQNFVYLNPFYKTIRLCGKWNDND